MNPNAQGRVKRPLESFSSHKNEIPVYKGFIGLTLASGPIWLNPKMIISLQDLGSSLGDAQTVLFAGQQFFVIESVTEILESLEKLASEPKKDTA